MKYFARKDNKGQVVEGSNVSSTRRSKTGRWFEFFYENCCDLLDYTSDFIRYFVRKNNKGQVVDGSLIAQKGKPKSGSWTEVFFPDCCFSERARYVGFYGIPFVEPYIPSILTPEGTRGADEGSTFTDIFNELSGTNFDSGLSDLELQYSEWNFSIVYSDSTGLSKSVIIRIPNYTKEDIQNATQNWLTTVIKPLVPTFKSVIEGDKIKIDAFDREVWVSLGNPIQIIVSINGLGSTDPNSATIENEILFSSIYGDFDFSFNFSVSNYPTLTMIPYFSTWDIQLNSVIAPTAIDQNVTFDLFGNPLVASPLPVGGADFSFNDIPTTNQFFNYDYEDL